MAIKKKTKKERGQEVTDERSTDLLARDAVIRGEMQHRACALLVIARNPVSFLHLFLSVFSFLSPSLSVSLSLSLSLLNNDRAVSEQLKIYASSGGSRSDDKTLLGYL